MQTDRELLSLIEQAARNLATLADLASTSPDNDLERIRELQERLAALRSDYMAETDALTRQVLKRAVERRRGPDRRRRMDESHAASVAGR